MPRVQATDWLHHLADFVANAALDTGAADSSDREVPPARRQACDGSARSTGARDKHAAKVAARYRPIVDPVAGEWIHDAPISIGRRGRPGQCRGSRNRRRRSGCGCGCGCGCGSGCRCWGGRRRRRNRPSGVSDPPSACAEHQGNEDGQGPGQAGTVGIGRMRHVGHTGWSGREDHLPAGKGCV